MVDGSFLPTDNWLGEDPLVTWGAFVGVRLPCGRNVEKKFLEGVVAVLTARWLVTKSLRGWRRTEPKSEAVLTTKHRMRADFNIKKDQV